MMASIYYANLLSNKLCHPVASKQTGRSSSHSGNAKDMMDMVPPPPQWEIPRTPVITAASTQETVVTTERDGGCSEEPHPLLKPAQGSIDKVASTNRPTRPFSCLVAF